jgi:hypothetical protein
LISLRFEKTKERSIAGFICAFLIGQKAKSCIAGLFIKERGRKAPNAKSVRGSGMNTCSEPWSSGLLSFGPPGDVPDNASALEDRPTLISDVLVMTELVAG